MTIQALVVPAVAIICFGIAAIIAVYVEITTFKRPSLINLTDAEKYTRIHQNISLMRLIILALILVIVSVVATVLANL